jgi:hypothetical protein
MAVPITKVKAFLQVEKDLSFFKDCLATSKQVVPQNPASVRHLERRIQTLIVQRNALILEATLTASHSVVAPAA